MPFYRMDLPDGTTTFCHVNFGRSRGTPTPCVSPKFDTDDARHGRRCARMAVALCDAPAGQTYGGKSMTCSAPMCERHRTGVGTDRDYCPRHRHLLGGA